MANHLRTELVLGALNKAIGQRRPQGIIIPRYAVHLPGLRQAMPRDGVMTSTGSAGDL